MAASPSVDHDIVGWMRERLEQASPDLLREMVQRFAEALMAHPRPKAQVAGSPRWCARFDQPDAVEAHAQFDRVVATAGEAAQGQ